MKAARACPSLDSAGDRRRQVTQIGLRPRKSSPRTDRNAVGLAFDQELICRGDRRFDHQWPCLRPQYPPPPNNNKTTTMIKSISMGRASVQAMHSDAAAQRRRHGLRLMGYRFSTCGELNCSGQNEAERKSSVISKSRAATGTAPVDQLEQASGSPAPFLS